MPQVSLPQPPSDKLGGEISIASRALVCLSLYIYIHYVYIWRMYGLTTNTMPTHIVCAHSHLCTPDIAQRKLNNNRNWTLNDTGVTLTFTINQQAVNASWALFNSLPSPPCLKSQLTQSGVVVLHERKLKESLKTSTGKVLSQLHGWSHMWCTTYMYVHIYRSRTERMCIFYVNFILLLLRGACYDRGHILLNWAKSMRACRKTRCPKLAGSFFPASHGHVRGSPLSNIDQPIVY